MKPKYYIYSWQAGAFRSDELNKSIKGYSSRSTAERIAKFRFDSIHDRIRYCVALTDEEAFAEMTRQNQPEKYMEREVYMAEARAGFSRMDVTLTLQTKGFESWNTLTMEAER